MKKIFFLALGVLFIHITSAQYVQSPTSYAYKAVEGRNALQGPVGCGVPHDSVRAFYAPDSTRTAYYLDTCNNVWYYFNSKSDDQEWHTVAGGGGGGGIGAVYAGECLLKINDSTLALDMDCLIAQDTIFSVIFDSVIINKKLRIPLTDTTHAKKGCGNIIYDTINEHFYGDVCINGVHYAWQCFDCSGGTVTSVATNNGTGITGGTITTTGTLAIDTTIISTKANVDSKTVTLNAGTNISIAQNATQNLGQNPSWTINATGFGTGTVTSVGLAAPSIFTVTGSPVTTSGTLTFSPNNAQGDIIYGSALNTLSYLNKSTTLGHVLTNEGTSNNPAWDFPIILTTTGTSGAATYTGRTLNIPQYSGTTYTASNGITLSGTNFKWGGTLTENTTITGAGFYSRFSGGRLEPGQGAAVAAANDLTLGNDGNTFSITGATQINAITTANWQAGSWVNLVFASTPTVKHNTAGGAGTAVILLAGAQDYTVSANDVLSLLYDGTSWHEVSRKIAGSSTGGAYWQLINGGTMTGVNTLTQNRANGFLWNGTYTATANNQYYSQIAPTATGRATTSDNIIGLDLSPTFTSGAATQVGIGLNINPTWNATGGSISTVGIKVKGEIWTTPANTYSIGQAATQFLGMYATNFYATTYRALNAAASFDFGSAGSVAVGRVFVTSQPGVAFATNGNLPSSSNGFMLESKGDLKAWGGGEFSQLTTPAAPSLTTTGTNNGVSFTYKIVARTANGSTTDAGSSATIATGATTLTGSNRVNISLPTETVGAAFYDVYLTATTGSATLGKIGTINANTFFGSVTVLQHTSNAQGDGTTPPTINTTGNVMVGTTSTNKSTLQVAGSTSFNYVAKTGAYTATDLDHTIDCTSGTFTVTLPTAVGITGRTYTVVNSGSGTITLGTTSSQTFVNITSAPTTLTLAAVGAGAIVAYEVQSNGANWIVISKVKNE